MPEVTPLAAASMRAAARSDVGRVRANNEDRVHCDPDRGIFAVVDGVGGQAAGEVAASTALDAILQRLQFQVGTPAERVREAIALANNEVVQAAERQPHLRGMACVLTVALVADGTLTAGHVGDTRLYKYRRGSLRKLTRDHSPVGEREDRGELGELEAMRHPRRNEVFREVGSSHRTPDADEFVEIVEDSFEPDAALLLCTDGLTDMVPASTLVGIIEQHAGNAAGVADALVEAANDAGGRDNVSVVFIEGPAVAAAAARRGPRRVAPVLDRTAAAPAIAGDARAPRHGAIGSALRSRAVAFVAGLLAGVGIVLGLAYWMRDALVPGVRDVGVAPRSLTVGAAPVAEFATIAAAMAQARAGDTIYLGPGEYHEQVIVRDGVHVVARPARAAVVRAPVGAPQPWTAVEAGGAATSRLSGLRIAGTPAAPIAVGVRLRDRAEIDDLDVSGAALAGIEIAGEGVRVMGASVHDNPGSGLAVRAAGARIVHSLLMRNGSDLSIDPGIEAALAGNVIQGDPARRLQGLTAAQLAAFRETNVVLPAPPSAPARPGAPGRRPR
jgi:serine/threonine protein phosphatase PrpC